MQNENLNSQLPVFSVSQITSLIKEILETSFRTITIEGEISNWRPSSSGHIYFTLKDNLSQIKAVIFRSAAYKLSFNPKDGDKVIGVALENKLDDDENLVLCSVKLKF